ncbi:hypothetical protein A5883_003589 [Enterococcus sp. 5B3_DIV0040]|nr:hypothetical protein A5883_003589 [Enterococcus sp. 5B3_DIV0040]
MEQSRGTVIGVSRLNYGSQLVKFFGKYPLIFDLKQMVENCLNLQLNKSL